MLMAEQQVETTPTMWLPELSGTKTIKASNSWSCPKHEPVKSLLQFMMMMCVNIMQSQMSDAISVYWAERRKVIFTVSLCMNKLHCCWGCLMIYMIYLILFFYHIDYCNLFQLQMRDVIKSCCITAWSQRDFFTMLQKCNREGKKGGKLHIHLDTLCDEINISIRETHLLWTTSISCLVC